MTGPQKSLTYNQASPSARVDWVDAAKGICIILVVMMHTTLGIEAAAGRTGWMHAVVEFAKPFRMPDFFMISGLFLAATIDRPWRLYLDRKVIHFFYFYILWVGIQFAFKAPFMMGDGVSLAVILRSLLFTLVQPFGTLWFIYMLPVFFVVTKLFRNSPWLLLGFAALLQILPISTHDLLPIMTAKLGVISVDSYLLLVDEFCSFYVYFLMGYLFAPKIFEVADWAGNHVAVALGLITAWFCLNLLMVVTGWAALPVLSLVLGMAGAAAIVLIASLLIRLRAIGLLTHIGSNSIVVYLAFFLPMIISRILLLKFFPDWDLGNTALIAIMVSVATPLIGYAVIQKIGFGRFLFHRPSWAVFANRPQKTKAALVAAE